MADHAWFQETFSDDKSRRSIAEMQVDPIAQIAWHMMDNESKKFFINGIKFERLNEQTGQEEEITVTGYKTLLHAIDGEESFWRLMEAFVKCKGLNGFTEDDKEVGLKKKTKQKKSWILTGGQYLKEWLRSTDTRPHKFSN